MTDLTARNPKQTGLALAGESTLILRFVKTFGWSGGGQEITALRMQEPRARLASSTICDKDLNAIPNKPITYLNANGST